MNKNIPYLIKLAIFLKLEAIVKVWLQNNINVFVGLLYAKLEANLFLKLQATVNVWLQNNINVFIGLIYAKLEANLLLKLEPNINIYLNNNPRFRGPTGERGERGLPGKDGEKGDKGDRGLPGVAGKDGEKGEKGDRGLPGVAGKDGEKGDKGDRGLPGVPGKDGEKGDKGDRGLPGVAGKDGEKGDKGDRGLPGVAGKDGEKGDKGDRGLPGVAGKDGDKGEKGDRGLPGVAGKDGEKGDKGDRGLPGVPGKDGEKGDKGDRGLPGVPGKDGLSDLTFTPVLTWNPATNRLELRLTINGKTKNTSVTIPMDCDFSELIEYLEDIQEKVTITPAISQGDCGPPSEPGQWYEFTPASAINANGIGEAFTLLSEQMQSLHETACKGVQPKVPTRDLPVLIECVEDENGDKQIQEMSLAAMQTNLGFVPPWAVGIAKDVIAPWAIDQALNWLAKRFTEQEKINQGIICKLEPGQDVTVLLPDPSAVWNTKGNYLLFFWYLESSPKWNHRTQLADPIDAIVNPVDASTVWATYFADLQIKLGNQWGQILTDNKARRSPLYRGWFFDKQEAESKLFQIAELSKIEIRTTDNPTFTETLNKTSRLTHIWETMKLRKVCVGIKPEDSDTVEILRAYEPPKTP